MLMEFSLICPDTSTRFPPQVTLKLMWIQNAMVRFTFKFRSLQTAHSRNDDFSLHSAFQRSTDIKYDSKSFIGLYIQPDRLQQSHTDPNFPSWRTLSSMCVVLWVSVLEMLHVSSHWYFSPQHATSVSTLLLTRCMFVWAEQEMSSVSE